MDLFSGKSVSRRAQQDKTKELIQPKSLTRDLRTYGIPLLAVGGFLGIIIFVTIPSIQQYFDFQTELAEKNTALDTKRTELKDLKRIAENQVEDALILENLNAIVPTENTRVVEFEDKIINFAQVNTLEIQDSIFGENIDSGDSGRNAQSVQENTTGLNLVRISGSFDITGNINGFRNMLSRIYNSNDFIVITSMDLETKDGSENAEVELVFSKYQFLEVDQESEQEILKGVSFKEAPDQRVIDFVKRKTGEEGLQEIDFDSEPTEDSVSDLDESDDQLDTNESNSEEPLNTEDKDS